MGKVGDLRRTLGNDFEVDEDMLRDALLHAATANIFYLPRTTKIDFFGRGYDGFDAMEFERRQSLVVTSTAERLFVKTAEDTILRKLLWYRDGGCVSDRQWRDVVSVLRINSKRLEGDYLDKWSKELCIGELLARAQGDAEG